MHEERRDFLIKVEINIICIILRTQLQFLLKCVIRTIRVPFPSLNKEIRMTWELPGVGEGSCVLKASVSKHWVFRSIQSSRPPTGEAGPGQLSGEKTEILRE